MLAQPDTQPKSVFKNPFLYSWTVLVIAVLVVGWVLFSRWQENRTIEKHAKEERTLKQQEQDRIAVEQLGGRELAIQNFYAVPAVIHRGETVQLCYGVANPKSVKLEPQSNPVWPPYSRCVDLTPFKQTTNTSTIPHPPPTTKPHTL